MFKRLQIQVTQEKNKEHWAGEVSQRTKELSTWFAGWSPGFDPLAPPGVAQNKKIRQINRMRLF